MLGALPELAAGAELGRDANIKADARAIGAALIWLAEKQAAAPRPRS